MATTKIHFDVEGMTCAACSSRIEKVLSKMEGVESVTVNLLKNSMVVEFDPAHLSVDQLTVKVDGIGYKATVHVDAAQSTPGTGASGQADSEDKPHKEQLAMRNRLITSAIFTVPLFYIAMGEMLGWPLPAFLTGEPSSMVFAFTQFLLVLPVLVVNRKYFTGGFKSLFRGSPNMDSLIALGSGAAFIYGIYIMYKMSFLLGGGDIEGAHHLVMSLYFESAGIILTLVTLGKFFEARAKGRTSDAINKLMDLAPKTAIVVRDGVEQEVPLDQVTTGETLIVKAGDTVPVDGVILAGRATVDESAMTGESLPVERIEGGSVIGGTISLSGHFTMRATAVGGDTTLAKIIQLVDDATSSKAPIARLADKISNVFVPVVITIAVLAVVVWLLLGHSFEFALSIGISVLVISCPCALGLATPTAIMVGTGKGAQNGILIKSAESLEITHAIDTVVLDKTGTVTEGAPAVTDVLLSSGVSNAELFSVAGSLETMSNHPLAAPIVEGAKADGGAIQPVSDYDLVPGQGIVGTIEGVVCRAGNRKLMEAAGVDVDGSFESAEGTYGSAGKTALYFSKGSTLLGMIAVADPIKPTSKEAIAKLTAMGLDVVLLTGDNARTGEAIGEQVGIKNVIAEVLPQDKEREVRQLQERGKKVAMVGDGINDAPALARANVGIAIGAGTDIAIESADIVLMKSDLLDVVSAIKLSKMTMRNIKQNLFWALIYNMIGIPIAAGIFYGFGGLLLNPMIAAAAMSFSSVSVVLNALRIRFFTPQMR